MLQILFYNIKAKLCPVSAAVLYKTKAFTLKVYCALLGLFFYRGLEVFEQGCWKKKPVVMVLQLLKAC